MDKIKRIDVHKHPYLESVTYIDGFTKTLYCIGNLPKTRQPTVAIIGSRKPTSYGREVTELLARQLANRGVVIVSGLALGIDSIAHRAALDVGGITIAVQANGLDQLYPRSNRQLAKDIVASGGAILSEYQIGTEPMRHHFLERNRIVSGLADMVIITEAAARSGTLNTAAHALTQNKELGVVPGNITSALSVGCNRLLRQGATPISSVEDVLEVLAINQDHDQMTLPLGNNDIEQHIIDALAKGLRDGDEIMSTIEGVSAADFNTALTMLEIRGDIKALSNNKWRLG